MSSDRLSSRAIQGTRDSRTVGSINMTQNITQTQKDSRLISLSCHGTRSCPQMSPHGHRWRDSEILPLINMGPCIVHTRSRRKLAVGLSPASQSGDKVNNFNNAILFDMCKSIVCKTRFVAFPLLLLTISYFIFHNALFTGDQDGIQHCSFVFTKGARVILWYFSRTTLTLFLNNNKT